MVADGDGDSVRKDTILSLSFVIMLADNKYQSM